MAGADDLSRWTDLERPPLSAPALSRALVREGSPWTSVEVVAATGSTNADLAAAAGSGRGRAGGVLVAEEQTAGRGRLDRSWVSPPRAGLTASVLLAPQVPPARWGWLPLLTGLAVADGLADASSVEVTLKWPNDVLAEDGCKLGGILVERLETSGVAWAVVGLGLNVSTREEELPVGTATSLLLAGATSTDRHTVLVAALRALADRLASWEDGLDPVEDYRSACSTVGRQVSVELPGAGPVTGTAVAVDDTGRLVVEDDDGGRTAVSAGDVMHLR